MHRHKRSVGIRGRRGTVEKTMAIPSPVAPARPGVVRVRPLAAEDVAWTAELQQAELPHGFFARLGQPFLRAYHLTFLESPFGIALVAERDGRPLAFLVGASEARPHRAWVLRRNRRRLAAAGVACLARHPHVLVELVRTRARRYARALTAYRGKVRYGDVRERRPTAILKHVVVAPDARGSGGGRLLVEEFVAEARARGAAVAQLTTVADGEAEGFWRRLGWKPLGADRDEDGRLHRVFARHL